MKSRYLFLCMLLSSVLYGNNPAFKSFAAPDTSGNGCFIQSVNVSCENFDPSLLAYGIVPDTASFLDSVAIAVDYTLFDTLCTRGTIVRTFTVFDGAGQSASCIQEVVVTYEQEYYVRFPNDVLVTSCTPNMSFGEPEFFGEDCELLTVSYTDAMITVVPDACYRIDRTWSVINWCNYNPNQGLQYVPNPNPNALVNHPTNLPGVTVSPLGTPQPWAPTIVRITPTDPLPTHYSTFYGPNTGNNNGYEYLQIIKIIDLQDPVVSNCVDSLAQVCDITENHTFLWNETYWWDSIIQSHNLCEGPADLSLTATDLCSGSNITINYLLFLDLDSDGTMETVINSKQPQNANEVLFGNALNANFTGGTPRAFDQRPVPPNLKYRFALQSTASGNNRTASVRWNTGQEPNTYVFPELPYGTHKIKWIVEDACGNETVCEYLISVKDCKKPTVVCINGLSVNLGPTGVSPTLSVNDFLQFANDNCTPDQLLKVAIRKKGTGTGFPVDAQGNPLTTISYDCTEQGTQFLEVWAMDKAGNADYCETFVIIIDNLQVCNDSLNEVVIACVENIDGQPLSVTWNAHVPHPSLPPVSVFGLSDSVCLALNSLQPPIGLGYYVFPERDHDPLNGVTTFDVLLIYKKILGLVSWNTLFQYIAGDVNKSGTITSYDAAELEKLITGIYTELPANNAWRFVESNYTFNPANPFSIPFSESVLLDNNSAFPYTFIGVKVGDVNGSAIPDFQEPGEDDVVAKQAPQHNPGTAAEPGMAASRAVSDTLFFEIEDRFVAYGDIVTVGVKAESVVQGYQFTLGFGPMQLLGVTPGPGQSSNNFGQYNDRLAVAWVTPFPEPDPSSFNVQFRALADGKISEFFTLLNQPTPTHAYPLNTVEEVQLPVALHFKSNIVENEDIKLGQNTPNPFGGSTVISFYLPKDSDVRFTVRDVTGLEKIRREAHYPAGWNQIEVQARQLGEEGIYLYQLEAGNTRLVKKMMVGN